MTGLAKAARETEPRSNKYQGKDRWGQKQKDMLYTSTILYLCLVTHSVSFIP
jgi:hypothetical protein